MEVSYSSNGVTTKVKGFIIEKKSASETKYTVTSKNKIKWKKGESSVVITVKPRINGSAANPITYQFSVKRDCVEPTVAFDESQKIYNPSLAEYLVYDQDVENGSHLSVEDVLIELLPARKAGESECGESDDEVKRKLLFAEKFSAPGAKVHKLTWTDDNGNPKYPDGKYRLVVSTHDNTISDNGSDEKKKEFWETYDKNGGPDLSYNDFPKSRNRCNNIKKMTLWKSDIKEIVLDFTKPTIETSQFSINANSDGKIIYAGAALEKDLNISVKVTDELSNDSYPVKAVLTLSPLDNLSNPLDAISHFDLSASMEQPGKFELTQTIIAATDKTVKSMIEVMQPIPDGIYAQKLVVKDPAGNTTEKDLPLLVIDETAPVIKNVYALGYAESGSMRSVKFEVTEENDIGILVNLDKVKTQVTDVCGEQTFSYTKKNGSVNSGYLEYEIMIPQGISGSCKTVIVAEDAYGNKRYSEWSYAVDYIPPEITSPSTDDEVSGNIAIYGHADDPFLPPPGGAFVMYELSYAPVDREGNVVDGAIWQSIGMSVPESQRCADFAYRSCKPVSQYSANSVLGYWNTNMIPDDENDENDGLGRTYRIRVVTYDQDNSKEAYVDVFVAAKQKVAPTITFDNLPSEMNFETTNTYNIDWLATLPLEQNSGLVRLEIIRLNKDGEKTVSVVNRSFENVVPNAYYGEPQGALDMGAYLWIDEDDKVVEKNRYHLKLVAGEKETSFNLSFYTKNSASLNIQLDGSDNSDGIAVVKDKGTFMGTIGTIAKTLSARASVSYVIETDSKDGLFWSLSSSTLKYDGAKFETMDAIPFYKKKRSSEEFAYVGSGKVTIGSRLQNDEIHIPSMMAGRNFVWDGSIDGTIANVPSGTYRFKVTLEGLDDNQSASDEKTVKITGKSVALTNVKADPENVDFSNVLPKITLHFNIDQDALVSVFVRAKDGSAPTDLKEFMKLQLDGHSLLLDKQLLAGRKINYAVNWDGTYGKSSQITPNKGGYEFVVQVYDLEGNLQKEETAPFKVVAKDMIEDKGNIILSIDGNSKKTVKHGGLDYLLANGMNDAILQFAPEGTRVVTDVVPVKFEYSGTQDVYAYPYERYSIGVQIHKRSINFWAVVAGSFRYNYEDSWAGVGCTDEDAYSNLVYLDYVSFTQYDTEPKKLRFNFNSGTAGTDLNGKMDRANAQLLLIAAHKVSNLKIQLMVKEVNDASFDKKKEAWKKLRAIADASFTWGPDANAESIFSEDHSKISGINSSGRQSEDSWVTADHATKPKDNSTGIYWDLGCDVGIDPSAKCVDLADAENIKFGENGRGNGIADEGEPMRGTTEKYNPKKHQVEIDVDAWTWKNSNGSDSPWNPAGCVGDKHTRHNLMFIFKLKPTARFWANPDISSDYGWNNLVNRYLTIDPMNDNFLFGENGIFKDVKKRYVNKFSIPSFEISNHDKSISGHYFINLLDNPAFQKYYYSGLGVVPLDQLADDVEMRLHFFKIDPSNRSNYPYKFNVCAFINNNPLCYQFSYKNETDKAKEVSPQIILANYDSKNFPMNIAIGLDNANPVIKKMPWPASPANYVELVSSLCGKDEFCGDEESDVEIDINSVIPLDDSSVEKCKHGKADYCYILPVDIQMGKIISDESSGYNLNVYMRRDGDYYKPLQGGSNQVDVTNGNNKVSVDHADVNQIPDGYSRDDKGFLRKNGCAKGCTYVAAKDPLMSKIDDDDDGLVAEDGKDAGNVPIDNDGDLAVDEDPNDAVRVKLLDLHFPFIGGGDHKSYITRNLSELLKGSADKQNVIPGNSDEKGWSILKKVDGVWSDNEIMLTKWEDSNDPKSFTRTALFYKDGKPHMDVEIVAANYMNSNDATKATIKMAPSKFDGRDRRLLEVKAKMNWKKGDKYEIYASSDRGWINLTPSPLGKLTNKELGTVAYWDVETSGYHQLLLIRYSGGKKYYRVFPVAVGARANGDNTVFADALGRSQVSTDRKVDFVDVVPLGKGEIPQTIPADAGLGPVVQIYPALTELKSATFNLRFSKDEVSGQNWQNATIYVVSEGMSPQPLQGIQWRYYDAEDNEIVGQQVNLNSGDWSYAIATGVLSVSEPLDNEESVQAPLEQIMQAPLGEQIIMDSESSSVSVKETEAGVYEVDFNVTSAIGE